MNQNQTQKIKEIFAQELNLEIKEINDDLAYNNCPAWDSLKHLQIVSQLETAFDIDIDISDVTAMETFGKLCTIMDKYLKP